MAIKDYTCRVALELAHLYRLELLCSLIVEVNLGIYSFLLFFFFFTILPFFHSISWTIGIF